MKIRIDAWYNALEDDEAINTEKVITHLLGHAFLIRTTYNPRTEAFQDNDLYLFAERNLEELTAYFAIGGFTLEKDNGYGVISLRSRFNTTTRRLGKDTTLTLFALAIIFDERRTGEVSLKGHTETSKKELYDKINNLANPKKKFTLTNLDDSLRILSGLQIIARGIRSDESDERLIIYPSILFAIDRTKIDSAIAKLDGTDKGENA